MKDKLGINIITPFPEMFANITSQSILLKAKQKRMVEYNIYNLFNFLNNKCDRIDDYPYGGGEGMILKPEPIFNAVKSILEKPIQKFFVNAGIYVFEPELVSKVESNKPVDMPNLLEQQIKDGKSVSVFPVYEYWMDVGHKNEYDRANKDIDHILN